MKKFNLALLIALAALFCFSSFGFCSEQQTTAPAAEQTITVEKNQQDLLENLTEIPLFEAVIGVLENDVEYRLNESSSLVFACNPFESGQAEGERYQPTSNISVGLKFSF